MRDRVSLLRGALALLTTLLLLTPKVAALPAGQQTYFLMGLEEQILDVLDEMAATNAAAAGFIPTPPTGAQSFFGVTVPNPGQPIVYDHGEDGYETDYYGIINGSVTPQATTEIWNDGPEHVWLVTGGGEIWFYDGADWTQQREHDGQVLTGLGGVDRGTLYAVGTHGVVLRGVP